VRSPTVIDGSRIKAPTLLMYGIGHGPALLQRVVASSGGSFTRSVAAHMGIRSEFESFLKTAQGSAGAIKPGIRFIHHLRKYLLAAQRAVLQQGAGDLDNAHLRLGGSHKTLGTGAQTRELDAKLQRREPLRQIVPRHLIVGLVTAIVDRATEQYS
jgi:hypothetical protein